MMASMGPSFPPHPGGMQQHPGAPPGHPMAPGMAHNPSQPGGTPGMPQHMVQHLGVSGPGPQMNPAALMAGMPPGPNPNAHAAMQHLNPAHAQNMFQQQHIFNNNQMQQQQQLRLQQLHQQQQARQALMASQAAYQNMNGLPLGIPVGMTPQQFNQLRSGRIPVASLPPHPQMAHLAQQPQVQNMNIAQQIAMQQQQIQMGQQGGNPNQHPMNPQQMNLQQQAQLAALQAQQAAQAQHAQAQAQAAQQQQQVQQQVQQQQQQQQHQQAQAQQQHQQQQAQQQQAQQAAQQQQQQGPGQPQPQQQPQQPQQQMGQAQPQGPQSQPGQVGPGANGPAQNQGPSQGPTPQPNAQQQSQAPPQTPQTTQAQQAQLVAQAQAQAQQQQQQQQAQSAGVANLMQQQQQAQQQHQQKSMNMKAMFLLKLMEFGEHMSGFNKGKDDLSYWNNFVQQFFSHKGIFRHTILCKEGDTQTEKQYELSYSSLARYFYTHFESHVKTIQLVLDRGITDRPLPNDCHFIESTKASLVYWFDSGSHLVTTGVLRAQFDSEQKVELLEFLTTGHEEYISRDVVIQAARPVHNWMKEWRQLNSQDGTHSPEMSNKKKAKSFRCPANPPPDFDLPQPSVKLGMGVTHAVHQFLEIVEIMGQMNPLFGFVHQHPGLAPYSALEQYVNQINSSGQGVNGQNMPQGGPRTPSFNQFPIGASPAMTNQMLPGSPHIGSPAPGQMQAPGMQLQASQQGTSSSGPSANTSPSQNNKRRRASAVKTEDDTTASAPTPGTVGTPQMNGATAKGKPPTPRMPKRMKGNPP